MLVVFAQVAAAAELCFDYAAGGSGAPQASVADRYLHHGRVDMVCVSDVVPANQAPAADPVNVAPDLGPANAVASLQSPTKSLQLRRTRDSIPFAPIAQFLLFQRLLL